MEIDVELEPPALDFRVDPLPEQIQYGDDNVLKHLRIEKGEVERALADAPRVIEGVYETGAQEHVYLETQGMLAWDDEGGAARPGVLVAHTIAGRSAHEERRAMEGGRF